MLGSTKGMWMRIAMTRSFAVYSDVSCPYSP